LTGSVNLKAVKNEEEERKRKMAPLVEGRGRNRNRGRREERDYFQSKGAREGEERRVNVHLVSL
jgi:hypothetical protein